MTDNVRDFAQLVADAASRDEAHPGVVFALRPAFDRGRPSITRAMTRALDRLLRADEPIRGARFLAP